MPGADPLPYPCRFGAPGVDPTVAIWGNSYARMWIPALAHDAEAHGVSGVALVLSKCPPLLGFDAKGLPGCLAFNRDASAFLATHTSLRTVVLGADWFLYDRRPRPARCHARCARRCGHPGLPAAGATAGRLSRSLGRWPSRRFAARPPPPPPTAAHARETQRISTGLIAAAAARHGATVLDPATRLCEGETCPVVRDGHPLFYDAGHLTVFAAQGIHGFFDPLFAP